MTFFCLNNGFCDPLLGFFDNSMWFGTGTQRNPGSQKKKK